MEPTVHDGDFLVFRANPVGTRQGKIEKRHADEGDWRHTRIVLSPLNPDYAPSIIPDNAVDEFRIVAEFIAVLRSTL